MLHLTKPNLELATQIRLTDPATFSTCLKAQGALQRLADAVDPATLFALATQTHTDVTMPEAVTALLADAELAIEAVSRFKSQFRAIEDAEKTRLAPLRSGATDRLFQVIGQLNNFENAKRSHQAQDAAKRKTLEDAGLTKDQIDAVTPAYDAAAAQVEADALTAEKTALEGFLKQGDEALLPVGFEPTPRIKVSIPMNNEIPVSARPFLRAELV